MLCFLLGLTSGQDLGFDAIITWILFLISAVSFVLFVHIEHRTSHPMVSFNLFSSRLFSVNLVTGFITFVASAGSVLLMPFFLENMRHFDPFQAGLLWLPSLWAWV